MPSLTGRTALYRYTDNDQRLLYVGITSHPKDRWKAHTRAPWAPLAAGRTLEWFDSRSEAAAAEVQAIKTEKPIFNKVYNFERVPLAAEDWPCLKGMGRQKHLKIAELIRAEIEAGKWLPGQKLPSAQRLAEATGVSMGTTERAIKRLRQENYVHARRAFGIFVSQR